MVATAGSNFSVVNGLDGSTKVPISTPVNDMNGNTVVAHLAMTVASGIATPISAANPVPMAAAALPLPAGAAQDGSDATGVTASTGGVGIRGWLSGIYARLGGTITVAFAAAQSVAQSGSWSVGITGTPTVNVNGTLPVSAAALPLPAGAASAANQPALHADGGALAHVANFPATQAVSAATLPLPTGAAQDGSDAIGVTAPAGGAGIRGWLSGIYARLGGTLTASVANLSALNADGGLLVHVTNTSSGSSVPTGTAGTPNANVVSVQGIGGGATLAVSAAALPLPTGAATAANQPALNADGGSLAHVTNFPATQPVSGTVAISGTVPVSGTFYPATQPVSLVSLPALASGSNTIGNVGIAGTAAVSAASLPLPAGAATAARQPAPGAAGTPSADVLSIQGVAGGTALVVSGVGAVGAAPVNPPLSVAGVDAAGNKQHLLTDASGRQLVIHGGGTGTDYSTGAAAATAKSGNLLLTVPATAARAFVEVQNQSAVTVSLVRDDGAGANQTLILLAPGSGAGSQGAGWSSATFKGRVRIFGTAGAQVAAYQE